jgi:hypothetical protein
VVVGSRTGFEDGVLEGRRRTPHFGRISTCATRGASGEGLCSLGGNRDMQPPLPHDPFLAGGPANAITLAMVATGLVKLPGCLVAGGMVPVLSLAPKNVSDLHMHRVINAQRSGCLLVAATQVGFRSRRSRLQTRR